MVRLKDRRRRGSKRSQIWRHLRTAMRLVLRRPTVAVTVIPVLSDGRIVLVRRVDNDRWTPPGGIIDWGETVEEAAHRELEEETGLELVSVERLVGVYSSPERDPRGHAISILVAARVRGEMEIEDLLELSEVHVFAVAEIPFGHMAFDGEQQLRDYLQGRTVVR